MRIIRGPKPRFDIGYHIGETGKIRFLIQDAERRTGLQKARARFRFNQPGGNPEQR